MASRLSSTASKRAGPATPRAGREARRISPDLSLQPTDGLILEEAYRTVTIREGDKVIELPAIQAAVRSLAISAMKGSRLSQRALAELVQQIESRKSAEQMTAMENAFDYKQAWSIELERRRSLGISGKEPIPHPDDIVINLRTGDVRTEGPMDEREKEAWDEREARRNVAQDEVRSYAQKHRNARSPHMKALWLREWHFEQKVFDLINDSMPKRYKAKLEHRSFAEGASREGKTLDAYRAERATRPRSKR